MRDPTNVSPWVSLKLWQPSSLSDGLTGASKWKEPIPPLRCFSSECFVTARGRQARCKLMLADGVLRMGGQCAAFAFLFWGGIMEPERQGKAQGLMRFFLMGVEQMRRLTMHRQWRASLCGDRGKQTLYWDLRVWVCLSTQEKESAMIKVRPEPLRWSLCSMETMGTDHGGSLKKKKKHCD